MSIPFPFQNGNYSDFHSIPIPEWKLSNNPIPEWNGNGMRNGNIFSHSPFPKACNSPLISLHNKTDITLVITADLTIN